jgi:hypothetical protein
VRYLRGLGIAFGVFAVSFVLHIVGGASNQDWLFGTAVALIYLSATGFGVIAWLAAGARANDRVLFSLGMIAGFGLTMSALWAANDRTFAAWQVPLGAALVLTTSALLYGVLMLWRNWRTGGSWRGQRGALAGD